MVEIVRITAEEIAITVEIIVPEIAPAVSITSMAIPIVSKACWQTWLKVLLVVREVWLLAWLMALRQAAVSKMVAEEVVMSALALAEIKALAVAVAKMAAAVAAGKKK
ncbi:Uncharacterised protein [Serratia fonticola]|uniref:Uncharacterized protein n=2 Tax=Serratia fonticola TaxID=47917 RepID=A0A3S5AN52_SERFO|nr:Uncharacterised protein [Serratia fonticola]CAI1897108.1 Uncharacterised protein [Serratia fonticola]CAI1909628.1 Uncharacterised protein [Serratia fonticola]CAI1918234.1 Uncharacterised protein [Serratia fonticola]VEI67067.1 Uncharacterised protein [Serratia fonticola]